MRDALFQFLDDLHQIGKVDESLFDTAVRDVLLSTLLDYSNRRTLSLPDDFGCFGRQSNELVKEAFVALAEKYESAEVEESLEQVIRELTASLGNKSKRSLQIDQLFGDFFFPADPSRKHFYAPLRGILYSNACYLAFMIAPPITVLLVAVFAFGQFFANGLALLALMLVASISTLVGIKANDYIKYRILKYEGVPGARKIWSPPRRIKPK